MTKEITSTQYLNETIRLTKAIAQSFLVLGERLKIIRDEKLWQADTGLTSFGHFLKKTDISEGNASKMIQVYEHYVLKLQLRKDLVATKPYSTLYYMKQELDTVDKAQKFLEDGDGLTREDAVKLHRERKHPDCEHVETYTVTFCKHCKLAVDSPAKAQNTP